MTMFMWIQLSLFVFACTQDVKGWEPKCPTLKDASPCESLSCEKVDGITKLKLLCVNIPPSFNFHKILPPPDDKIQVEALRIINLQVANFTQDMFHYKPLREISISNANITSLPKGVFEGVEYLSLINCNLTHQTDAIETVRYIPKLKSLYLTGNHIKVVKWSWFKEKALTDNLVKLTLKQNKISIIEDNAFHTLDNLESLDLSDNNIRTLKRNFFPHELDALSLGYNQIEELPDDLFNDMDHLRFLRLERNNIKDLKADVFEYIFRHGQLRIADLRGNPIHCGCEFEWIPKHGQKPGRFYGYCNSPKELQGRYLAGITYQDIHCAHGQKNS